MQPFRVPTFLTYVFSQVGDVSHMGTEQETENVHCLP